MSYRAWHNAIAMKEVNIPAWLDSLTVDKLKSLLSVLDNQAKTGNITKLVSPYMCMIGEYSKLQEWKCLPPPQGCVEDHQATKQPIFGQTLEKVLLSFRMFQEKNGTWTSKIYQQMPFENSDLAGPLPSAASTTQKISEEGAVTSLQLLKEGEEVGVRGRERWGEGVLKKDSEGGLLCFVLFQVYYFWRFNQSGLV